MLCQLRGASLLQQNKRLLTDIDLTIHRGESWVFTGPSGGGKSTLLKALVGGATFSAQSYWFDGTLVDANNIHAVRQTVAYVPQQPALSAAQTALAFLQAPFQWRALRGHTLNETKILAGLDALGLDHSVLAMAGDKLSGGQQQRLSLLRALLTERKVLILDEPTSALDDDSTQRVINLLFKSDFTLISASHDSRWIERCAQQARVENAKVTVL